MKEVDIISAIRTPIGSFRFGLFAIHALFLISLITGCASHNEGVVSGKMIIRAIDSSEVGVVEEEHHLYYDAGTLQAYVQGTIGHFEYDSIASLGADKWAQYRYDLTNLTDTVLKIRSDTFTIDPLDKQNFDQLIADKFDILYKIFPINEALEKSTTQNIRMGNDSTGYLLTPDSMMLITVNKKLAQMSYNEPSADAFIDGTINPRKEVVDFAYSGDTLKRVVYYKVDTAKTLYDVITFKYENR